MRLRSRLSFVKWSRMSFVCVRKKKCVFSEKRFRLILNDMETRNQTLKVVLNLNVLLWFTWKMKCHVKIQVDFGRPCDFLTQSIVLHKDLFRCALVPPVLLWYYSIIWQMRGKVLLVHPFWKLHTATTLNGWHGSLFPACAEDDTITVLTFKHRWRPMVLNAVNFLHVRTSWNLAEPQCVTFERNYLVYKQAIWISHLKVIIRISYLCLN